MTDAITDRLNAIIQDASLEGTLSKRAIDQFQTLLEENTELKEKNESQRKQLSSLRDDLGVLNNRSEVMRNELESYQARESELVDRERQQEVLEMSVKYEQKRVDDHKNMVALVFRNTVLKSNVVLPGRDGFVDQYGTTQYGESSATQPVETEET